MLKGEILKTQRRYHSSNQIKRPYFLDKIFSIIQSPISTVHIHHDFQQSANLSIYPLTHSSSHHFIHTFIFRSYTLQFSKRGGPPQCGPIRSKRQTNLVGKIPSHFMESQDLSNAAHRRSGATTICKKKKRNQQIVQMTDQRP